MIENLETHTPTIEDAFSTPLPPNTARPFALLRAITISITFILIAMLIAIILTDENFLPFLSNQNLPAFIRVPLMGALGFAIGMFSWFNLSISMQQKTSGSPLSMVLNRARATHDLEIGTLAAQVLLNKSTQDSKIGPRFVYEIERLAVCHLDEIRITGDDNPLMSNQVYDQSGEHFPASYKTSHTDEEIASSVRVQVNTQTIVIRNDHTKLDQAFDDGHLRAIFIRQSLPSTLTHSLIEKTKRGPIPLRQIMEFSGIEEDLMVKRAFINKPHSGSQAEIHLILEPRLVRWRDVRTLLDPHYARNSSQRFLGRLIALVKAIYGRHLKPA